ncbi:MAG: DUF6133 family protein [Bacteroidales bacterium]|nr:DUF6133 family protein [Bacteroidales bacterium]
MINRIKARMRRETEAVRALFMDTHGEFYVDKVIGIVIAVVIGAAMLAFLYVLFNENVLPSMADKIQQMFN